VGPRQCGCLYQHDTKLMSKKEDDGQKSINKK
jgi:hypothetical protein